ncbi:hypothetical protein [Cohaesibacter intestini]|uniref:hypothetical protein n=1 Tax=Cohaesibacter intestini TaxID=2211145 RepID=UPI0018E57FF8|nr:hypothetical protein [Cohaesibacter intestini]
MSILDHWTQMPQLESQRSKRSGLSLPDLPQSPIWWPILLHIVVCSLALWALS